MNSHIFLKVRDEELRDEMSELRQRMRELARENERLKQELAAQRVKLLDTFGRSFQGEF